MLYPEIAKTQEKRKRMEQQLASMNSITYDATNKSDYVSSIPVNAEDENLEPVEHDVVRKMSSNTAPKKLKNDMPRSKKFIDREDDYRRRRLNRIISPERHDPSVRTNAKIKREKETLRLIAKKEEEEECEKPVVPEEEELEGPVLGDGGAEAAKKPKTTTSGWDLPDATPGMGRRNRWDSFWAAFFDMDIAFDLLWRSDRTRKLGWRMKKRDEKQCGSQG